MESTSWIEAARGPAVDEVAAALGLDVRRGRFRCPACPERRERRSTCGPTADRRGWRCHRCREGGDGLDLAALVMTGARLRDLPAIQQRPVREWFAARGWGPSDVAPRGTRRTLAPSIVRPLPAAPPEAPPPVYPPAGELAALWNASTPLGRRPDGPLDAVEMATTDFLWRRRFWSPADVGWLTHARELPLPGAYPWPPWWPRTWASTWRLALPAYTPDGRFASLHARAVTPDAHPKARWPLDYQARGLLLADWAGRLLLRGDARLLAVIEAVVVVEGVPDLIAATFQLTSERLPWAVLGATSGGFAALARVTLPDDLPVFFAQHADKAGDRYAREVADAVSPRLVKRLPLTTPWSSDV